MIFSDNKAFYLATRNSQPSPPGSKKIAVNFGHFNHLTTNNILCKISM